MFVMTKTPGDVPGTLAIEVNLQAGRRKTRKEPKDAYRVYQSSNILTSPNRNVNPNFHD
jgi:hypothetical protein